MCSDAIIKPKTKALPPPYVIVSDYPDKSGMNAIVMYDAQVEVQPDGSVVIKGKTPGYVYNLDAAVHTVRLFRGDFDNK